MAQNFAYRRQVLRRELIEISIALFIAVILFGIAVSVRLFFDYM
jgi:hypothetical protein